MKSGQPGENIMKVSLTGTLEGIIYLFIYTGGTVKIGQTGENIMKVSLTGKLTGIVYLFIY